MWWNALSQANWNLILNALSVVLGGGALGVVLSHFRGMKGLDNTDVADIRRHYAEELAAMRRRDDERDEAMQKLEKHWREMVGLADKRHAECVAERDELRDQLNAIKVELAGVKAQIRSQATDRVLLMEERCPKPSETAPHSLAAAQRLKDSGK